MALVEDIEAVLREKESVINETSRDLSRLRGEYATAVVKLRDAYHPKLLPSLRAVHVNGYYQRRLEVHIKWLETKAAKMEKLRFQFFEARDMRAEREALFDELTPQFEAAFAAMEAVTRDELAVLRGYASPPPVVLATVEALMAVRGEEDTSFDASRVALSETYYYSFLITKCRSRVRQELDEKQAEVVERYLLEPDHRPENVKKASTPCGAVSMWLHALSWHYHLAAVTAPRKATAEEVQQELDGLRRDLQMKLDGTADARQRLEALDNELTAAEAELRRRYDKTMVPMHDVFLEANEEFNTAFAAPGNLSPR